ncbi:hypothetical protein [Myroides sp. DW712]|uniref:hypothetical protein n=1 Tax=Myroides sp. DW712 TaxID=3389800 RepID=UPI00397AE104
MNKILVVVAAILSLLSCQGKTEVPRSKKEVVEKDTIKVEGNKMDKTESDKVIVLTVSGRSLKNVKTTLAALEHMIHAIEKAIAIELADPEDSLSYEDYIMLSKTDVEALNELLGKAFQAAGVKQPTEVQFQAALKKFFQVDLSDFEHRKRAWKKFDDIVLTPAFPTTGEMFNDVVTNPCQVMSQNQLNYYFDIQNRFTLSITILANCFVFVKDEETNLKTIDQIYDQEKDEFYLGIDKSLLELNKYILYNDRASFSWLLHYDPEILRSLLESFSYQEENLLNGWLLNEKRKQVRLKEEEENQHAIEKVTGVFAFKNYQEELEIREKLMQYIDEVTTAEDNDLLLMLDDYATEIVSFDNNSSDELRKGFTQDELYKIFAYAAYYSYKGFVKYDKGLGRFSSTRENWPNFCALTTVGQNADVQEALKKNMYYDIPGLKEAVEHIEQLAALSDED